MTERAYTVTLRKMDGACAWELRYGILPLASSVAADREAALADAKQLAREHRREVLASREGVERVTLTEGDLTVEGDA